MAGWVRVGCVPVLQPAAVFEAAVESRGLCSHVKRLISFLDVFKLIVVPIWSVGSSICAKGLCDIRLCDAMFSDIT